ncbi:MAG: UDP-N-acetylmuramate--L-alanine ligase [Candidatus Gracilibacteria bacterium]|nr:UDP-N-acetylmuramate--L-alanine ligase [Candidatus Gracilibacteria bacterium]
MQKYKVYIIGIGGIGISALARYYISQSYTVYGSDKSSSELIENLKNEGINITIGENPNNINEEFSLVVYSEAIGENQSERLKAKELGIKTISYPKALSEIANTKKLITIAGTHGKSTTTSMTSLVLKNSNIDFTSIVGTILKEFGNKNFYHRRDTQEDEYFIIEACEYKGSFLNYKPSVGIITNIELDHVDYYKNMDNYLNAFRQYLDNIIPGGFAILNGNDIYCKKLLGQRNDIKYIEVFNEYFIYDGQIINYPIVDIKIPGEHIKFDSRIAYVIGHMIGILDKSIIDSLESYNGVWRRMEIIGKTVHNNILVSDYGHHPTEISLTIKSIKNSNMDKILLTIFQPHQYSRTYELLEDFKNCFSKTDKLIIPNIYESRDTKEDKEKINTEKLVELINHNDKINGKGLENTLKLIEEFDKNNTNAIILLLGAGDIDNLRYKIKTV